MKTTVLSLTFLLLYSLSIAQISYQAVVRNSEGIPETNIDIDVEVSILQGGEIIYSESHPDVNTGSLGILNLAIGSGENQNIPFSDINWSQGGVAVQLLIDGNPLPASPILSVPVAEYAKNAGSSQWNTNDEENLYFNNGLVGIGTTTPEYNLDVRGILNIEGIESPNPAHTKLRLRAQSSNFDNRIRSLDENGDIMWQQILGRRPSNNFELINEQTQKVFWVTQNGVLNVSGINGSGAAHTKVSLVAQSADFDNRIRSLDENNEVMWQFIMGRRPSNNFQLINEQTQNVFWVTQSGQTNVKCLKINGGCDIKEDFDSNELLVPGEVVVLDEEFPGKLKRTSEPYDKKVAGVISGANGITPGMTLSQEGFSTGKYPLAMVGQVYVKATGKVKVGDLLTTSSKPGYAMAAKSNRKSPGAVIGKAMSGQDSGEGFVLVLVNLQ